MYEGQYRVLSTHACDYGNINPMHQIVEGFLRKIAREFYIQCLLPICVEQ